jgi:hypothetical protein
VNSDKLAQNDHIARLQRLLDRLEQVTKQAKDLSRMAAELHQEAAESISLVKATTRITTAPDKPKRKRRT